MHYPVDRDLSHGQNYPPFEQLGPDLKISGEYAKSLFSLNRKRVENNKLKDSGSCSQMTSSCNCPISKSSDLQRRKVKKAMDKAK